MRCASSPATSAQLSAVVATQAKQWLDTGSKTWLDVTSPDNVLLSGRLANGAVASVHIGAIPFAGSGYRMEIYGRDGTLVAAGEDSPQLSEVSLHGAKGGNTLAADGGPGAFQLCRARYAVWRSHQCRADVYAVRSGDPKSGDWQGVNRPPDFETAVELHHLVDAIKQASDSGREVIFD